MRIKKVLSFGTAAAASIFVLCGADGGCFPSGNSYVSYQKQISTVNEGTIGGQIVNRIPRPHTPIAGLYIQDDAGAVGPNPTAFGSASGSPYSLFTDGQGNYTTTNERLNANWDLKHNWTGGGCHVGTTNLNELPAGQYYAEIAELTFGSTTPYYIACNGIVGGYSAVSPAYAPDANLPGSLSDVASAPLSTAYGSPQLWLYNRNGQIVAQQAANSIAPDGVTASFPYPSGLSPDMYGTAIMNTNPDGSQSYAGGGHFLSIGHVDTSFTRPFAVALGYSYDNWTDCQTTDPYNDMTYAGQTTCNSGSNSSTYKVVSLYDQGAVNINGSVVSTGAHPTVVLSFGSVDNATSSESNVCGGCTKDDYSDDQGGTAGVLVLNTGSNTVSIIGLARSGNYTLPVGAAPVAAVLDNSGSTAYIANFNDGTISSVDLNANTVTTTAPVGLHPSALAVDPSGNLWVGGAGYIASLDPSSLATTSRSPVNGNVLTLGASGGSGNLIASVVSDGSGSPQIEYSRAQVSKITLSMSAAMSNGTGGNPPTPTQIASSVSAQPYATSAQVSQLVHPGQIATGALVSASYNNSLTAFATPTGFSVINLDNGEEILSGNTPGPVRSIVFDGSGSTAYMAVPDANQIISVPLPQAPY